MEVEHVVMVTLDIYKQLQHNMRIMMIINCQIGVSRSLIIIIIIMSYNTVIIILCIHYNIIVYAPTYKCMYMYTKIFDPFTSTWKHAQPCIH